jgi:hypothetical protein
LSVDRKKVAEDLAEATRYSVTADPKRVTFINDDPPQVIIWTVTDEELGELLYKENTRAKHFGGRKTDDFGALWLPLHELLNPFEGSRGYIYGTDLMTIYE